MRKKLTHLQRSLVKHSRSAAACAGVMVLASCSAPPGSEFDDDGPAEFGGPLPGASVQSPAAPGTPAAPAAPAPNGAPAANAGPSPTPSNEQPASNGTPIAPSTPPANNGNNAGANAGAGGASMVPPAGGDLGAGGSSMEVGAGGAPPVDPPVAQQPPPVTPPPPPAEPPPPVAPPEPVIDTECPDGAIFCSGFEQTTFPVGTANIFGGTQFEDAFQLDATQFNSGSQSLFLPLTTQAFSYRVMAIPVSTQAFWARLFVFSDTLLGDADHDGIFAISSGDLMTDNNNETRVEFSEQEGTIVLNRSTDQITFPIDRPSTLPGNTWHCLEARFDGNAGDIEVFANGQAIISSLGNPQFQFTVQTFRIGTLQFHSPRNVWFDDVVLDTERVGCN